MGRARRPRRATALVAGPLRRERGITLAADRAGPPGLTFECVSRGSKNPGTEELTPRARRRRSVALHHKASVVSVQVGRLCSYPRRHRHVGGAERGGVNAFHLLSHPAGGIRRGGRRSVVAAKEVRANAGRQNTKRPQPLPV